MKKEDATFDVPFSLQATRSDYVHALVAHFDVVFGACHKPIVMTTSPKARATHWKQTVFYLQDTLTVGAGETIEGRLACRPNAKNPRDLDIEIAYKWEGQHGEAHRTQEYRMR
jgi:protein arginine N-methyltransferase 1